MKLFPLGEWGKYVLKNTAWQNCNRYQEKNGLQLPVRDKATARVKAEVQLCEKGLSGHSWYQELLVGSG